MAIEIERKFLIARTSWRALPSDGGTAIRQFYLAIRDGFSSRIRTIEDRRAVLTLKSGSGLSRGEFEYDIPLQDAHELEPSRIGNIVQKRRYRVSLPDGLTAEVDVFAGHLASLEMVEVELPQVDHQFPLPEWFGREVTDDPSFSNAQMAIAAGHLRPQFLLDRSCRSN